MITCKYTKTIKTEEDEITTSLEVSDDIGHRDKVINIIDSLWDKFEAKLKGSKSDTEKE